MRLPNFTASASLDPSRETYRTFGLVSQGAGLAQTAFVRGRSCMARCLDEQGDDPYAYENCHCICYGRPGHTCWLM